MKSLVVLISGSGSNLKALLDAVARGEIRAQVKAVIAQAQVPVLADDTPQTLQARIAPEEHRLLVTTVARLLDGDSL